MRGAGQSADGLPGESLARANGLVSHPTGGQIGRQGTPFREARGAARRPGAGRGFQRGFSLFEVVAAILVFGITFGTIAGGMMVATKEMQAARDRARALDLAQETMQRLRYLWSTGQLSPTPTLPTGILATETIASSSFGAFYSIASITIGGFEFPALDVEVAPLAPGTAEPLLSSEGVRLHVVLPPWGELSCWP